MSDTLRLTTRRDDAVRETSTKTYSLVCKHSGRVKGRVVTDAAYASSYIDDDTDVVEGSHCFRSSWRNEAGQVCARTPASISTDVEVCLPGDTITLSKPSDCLVQVGDRITAESVFAAGEKDFRAICVGKYTGEIHVIVRSEEQIREAALKTAMEEWFREHAEGKKILQAPVRSLGAKARQRLKS